jgi:eukaryotic-like serine/threonine-protein kinase
VDADAFNYLSLRARGLRALTSGRIIEALQALGEALRLRPDLAEAHVHFGTALQEAGRNEAARAAFHRALDVESDCDEAKSHLALLPPSPPVRKDFDVGDTLKSIFDTTHVYEVLDKKAGGFGTVYIVRKDDGRIVALKTFQARYLWNDANRERFEREVLIWAALRRHPNVVSIQGFDRIEGFPCVVLEYISGGDLAHQLRGGALELESALQFACQLCDGLAHAHETLGLIHRDVKPPNCLLTPEGTLKVTDFGLARAFGEMHRELLDLYDPETVHCGEYTIPAGTRSYMAPEQIQIAAKLDVRTDIYAFGVTLYEMLTGELPRHPGQADQFIRACRRTRALPQPLLQLIFRCVRPDQCDRPAGWAEVREELESIFVSGARGRPAPSVAAPLPVGKDELQARGAVFWALKRPLDALRCIEEALLVDPGDYDLWNDRGVALWEAGRHEEALAAFHRSLAIEPRHVLAWKNMGLPLLALNRRDEALDCFNRALELDSTDFGAWGHKGRVLSDLKRFDEAVFCFDRALGISPRENVLFLEKGSALAMSGRLAEAVDTFRAGLAIAPRDADIWGHLGHTLHKIGEDGYALICLTRALEINGRLTWVSKLRAAIQASTRKLTVDVDAPAGTEC